MVILIHCYGLITNIGNRLESLDGYLIKFINHGPMFVNVFIMISGFLCALTFLSTTTQSPTITGIISRLFQRYIRFTLSLLAAIGVRIVYELVGSGPQWYQYVDKMHESCHQFWWFNLLYMQNNQAISQLVDKDLTVFNMCQGETWSLAVDMQLFIISPLLILLLTYNDIR
ncbi:O-acyltransferase like protein-like [Oppia nitens]|uniref:O-acyltransferase like protein-like n=1 Tax=Oppia nitens TaxID=1686743 RepID=UPI0023DB3870|nr:O-acyltransferase like protein-like [Oppia nitens]